MRNNGLKTDLKVLDVGSGSGIMTHFLAQYVGIKGHVLSIDNSPEQLARAKRYCDTQGDTNISFQEYSAYDLGKLNEKFDLIYCRFVLHHLENPRHVIELFHQCLNPGGLYIAEEGIISAAFAYPPSPAWHYVRTNYPDEDTDGVNRDGDFGMKLIYWMNKAGFQIKHAGLIQPLLVTLEEKQHLLDNRDAYKRTALSEGLSEADWAQQTEELINLVNNDISIVGFYQSCQVCGMK